MIMAIAAVVVIAGIMALALSLNTQTSKRTTDLYLYEQAQIYTRSAAEFALLQIANDGACFHQSVNISPDGLFNLNVTIRYIYDAANTCAADRTYTFVNTPEQNGSVLMDITVSTDAGTEPIRVFKRTIQKL